MKKRKLTVLVLAAAMLAAQTSCDIDGGVIGFLTGKMAETEEPVPETPNVSGPVAANLCADYEWAVNNAPDFTVSNATELISAAYWVNHISEDSHWATITLADDIDLSGYLWEPIGCANTNVTFAGEIDGGGHTISHLRIRDQLRTGFVGNGASLSIHDISFEDASVEGAECTGIVCGEKYGSDEWRNISVSGRITTSASADYGAIGGRTPDIEFIDCYADVTVNGQPFEYFTWQQYRDDNNAHIDDYSLYYDQETGTVKRSIRDKEAENLLWVISRNGERVLGRGCEEEYTVDPFSFDIVGDSTGLYSVYLEAFYGGSYLQCSNVCSIEMVPPEWTKYCGDYDLKTEDPYEIDFGTELDSDKILCNNGCADAGKYKKLYWIMLVCGYESVKKPFAEDEPGSFTRMMFEANQSGMISTGENTIDIFVAGETEDGTLERISNVIEETIDYSVPEHEPAGTPAE